MYARTSGSPMLSSWSIPSRVMFNLEVRVKRLLCNGWQDTLFQENFVLLHTQRNTPVTEARAHSLMHEVHSICCFDFQFKPKRNEKIRNATKRNETKSKKPKEAINLKNNKRSEHVTSTQQLSIDSSVGWQTSQSWKMLSLHLVSSMGHCFVI